MSHHSPDFQVTAPLEVLSLLRSLEERNTLIHLHVPGRHLAVITTILHIEDEEQTLIIDNASEDDLNQRLLQADSLSLEAQLDKVRILFSVTGAKTCLFEGKPALRVPFPEVVTRLQRREYYRIDIPLSAIAMCTLPLSAAPYKIRLGIRDISSGGISLLDHDHVLAQSLGKVFEYCTLELPDQPSLQTALKIVRAMPEKLANEKTALRVGCAFIDISNQTRIQLQRYIGQLERKIIARQRGLE